MVSYIEKIRNTARFLLANIDGLEEIVDVSKWDH